MRIQVGPCCLVQGKISRANLNKNKRIFKWRPFWKKVLFDTRLLKDCAALERGPSYHCRGRHWSYDYGWGKVRYKRYWTFCVWYWSRQENQKEVTRSFQIFIRRREPHRSGRTDYKTRSQSSRSPAENDLWDGKNRWKSANLGKIILSYI